MRIVCSVIHPPYAPRSVAERSLTCVNLASGAISGPLSIRPIVPSAGGFCALPEAGCCAAAVADTMRVMATAAPSLSNLAALLANRVHTKVRIEATPCRRQDRRAHATDVPTERCGFSASSRGSASDREHTSSPREDAPYVHQASYEKSVTRHDLFVDRGSAPKIVRRGESVSGRGARKSEREQARSAARDS